MAKPTIAKNQIVYSDHVVTFDLTLYEKFSVDSALEEMAAMADNLSEDGTLVDHVEELNDMNNDGSWTVAFLNPENNNLILSKGQAEGVAQALSYLNNLGCTTGRLFLSLSAQGHEYKSVPCKLDLDLNGRLVLQVVVSGQTVKEWFSSQATFAQAYGLN